MKKKVWIIGANSDIARKLILQMKVDYDIIALVRNVQEMRQFVDNNKLAAVSVEKLDLDEKESIREFLKGKETPDIIVFAQGMLKTDKNVLGYLEEMVQCNYVSGIEIIESFWQKMIARKSGCIVAITSVAADRGKASNKLYSSTKAAFSSYLQALMQEGRLAGIQVLDIKPGYVRTKMLRQNEKAYHSVLAAEPEKVADAIYRNMKKGKSGTVYVKKTWHFLMLMIKLLPEKLYIRMHL